MTHKAFPVSNVGITAAFEHVETILHRENVGDAVLHRLSVIIDELCANMIRHDPELTPDKTFELGLAVTDAEVSMTISDTGGAFNPLEFHHDVLPEIGGHGISLVKSLSSGVSYSREGGRNHLKILLLREE